MTESMMLLETWVSVSSHPDYDVSDQGRVRRRTGGKGVRAGRILVPQRQPNGYYYVNLYLRGIRRKRTLQSVVAEAFLGPRPPGREVNHLDGDKANNAASNLEYVSSSSNKQHAARSGLAALGIRNGAARLTDDQVEAIRLACALGRSQHDVARQFGISQGYVSRLVKGKSRRLIEHGGDRGEVR